MMAILTSILAAYSASIKELSLFWLVIISMGSGIGVGLIVLAVLWMWGKWRSDLPPASASKLTLGQPRLVAESRNEPKVIPIKYGIGSCGTEMVTMEDMAEGLFFKNIGGGPAFDVIAAPFQVGHPILSFVGPEVTYLEVGDTCFFRTYVEHGPGSVFKLLRDWQTSIEDLAAEAEGRIHYKDVDGMEYETRYKIGADVLNRDSGLVVRVETGSNPKRNP